ncbi:intramolecular oxidoreductase [Aureococcus anophagefferens]|nr:intramolecular oxidoreductase [Aureococcus anophagefferens]
MMRALASLVALLVARAAAIEEDGVLVLTASNFQNKVNEQYDTGMMVEFYAPWCKHCQALAPVYAEAAQALKGDVVLAKIDATQAQALAQQHGATGYPSVKFFKQGRVIDAQGVGMEAEQIAAATGPGVRVLAFFKTNKTKAARSFLNAVDEFRYPIDFFIGTDEALKSKAFDVAERRFLNEGKADESSLLDDPLAKLKPLSLGAVPRAPSRCSSSPTTSAWPLKLGDGKDGRKKLEKATSRRNATFTARDREPGKVLHIIMFKPPDDDGDADEDEVAARDELRAVLSFLKIDRTPAPSCRT